MDRGTGTDGSRGLSPNVSRRGLRAITLIKSSRSVYRGRLAPRLRANTRWISTAPKCAQVRRGRKNGRKERTKEGNRMRPESSQQECGINEMKEGWKEGKRGERKDGRKGRRKEGQPVARMGIARTQSARAHTPVPPMIATGWRSKTAGASSQASAILSVLEL